MQHVMKALRQTGRTTHMVRLAQEYARKQGRPAYAVFDTQMEVDQWKQSHPDCGVIFCTIQAVTNVIDRATLKYKDDVCEADRDVFIDHGMIERRFGYLIDMLHQYDGMMRFDRGDLYPTNFEVPLNGIVVQFLETK